MDATEAREKAIDRVFALGLFTAKGRFRRLQDISAAIEQAQLHAAIEAVGRVVAKGGLCSERVLCEWLDGEPCALHAELAALREKLMEVKA